MIKSYRKEVVQERLVFLQKEFGSVPVTTN
jgi:hypothetical protein